MSAYQFCPQCTRPLTVIEHGGLTRPACPDAACGFVLWDNPVPVVAAIVEHQGDIILARNALWPEHMFALITGFLERSDPAPEVGVLREVEEELGLQGRVERFVGHYPAPQTNQLIIAYHVIATGEIRLNEELLEYKRVRPDQLQPWPAATGLALRDWMIARGLQPRSDEEVLQSIAAYRAIGPLLSTAGQPTPEHLVALRARFKAVINLSEHDSPGAFASEGALLQRWGLRYYSIPVDWENPTVEDFDRFCDAMNAEHGRAVFVHCAANLRVSVFVYLYRVIRLGVDLPTAQVDLMAIWQPQPTWQAFIQRVLKIHPVPE